MAIAWGAWDYGSGGGGFRIGIETTRTSVSSSSSSVTFTFKVYVQNQYNVDDVMTLNFSGSAGSHADVTFDNESGTYNYYALRSTKTYTYTYAGGSYGTSPGTRDFRVDLSGAFNGANPYQRVVVTIPARPYVGPDEPTGVTATRNSDTQATVTWTRHPTTDRPYVSQTVQMRSYSGGAWGPWINAASVSGSATSYVKTGLVANRGYQFQVRANNSSGSSSFVVSGAIYMTPAPPSSVSSAIAPGGASVVTTWVSAAFESINLSWTVQRSVNGAAYADVATGLASAVRSWTDPSPGAGTNRYRVTVTHVGLTSAPTEGNLVTTAVPPLAPTQLSPNGTAVDFDLPVVLSWKHNHGGDGAAQSAYELQVSTNGGSTWSALASGTSSFASHSLAAATLVNGTPYLWRVRTTGIASVGAGAWSASAPVTGSSTPVVTILAPSSGATVTAAPVTVSWDYNQDELSPQSAWEVTLYAADNVTVLQSLAEDDASGSTELDYPFEDDTSYIVKVRARSGAGIWSAWVSRSFDFELLPPAAAVLDTEFDPPTGTMILHLTSEAVVPGVTVAIETVTVERRVNGGAWTKIGEGIPVPNDFLDLLPVTNGANEYRVTSVSASPSYFVAPPVEVIPDNPLRRDAGPGLQWVFVNYGPAFAQVLRFRSEPDLQEVGGRVKASHEFLGRTRPVPAFGDNASRRVSVGGKLVHDAPLNEDETIDAFDWDSPPADWTFAGRLADIVCYRDFTGRRIFGSLSDVQAADVRPGLGTVGFTVTENDFAESGGTVEVEEIPLLDGGAPALTGLEIVIDGGAP